MNNTANSFYGGVFVSPIHHSRPDEMLIRRVRNNEVVISGALTKPQAEAVCGVINQHLSDIHRLLEGLKPLLDYCLSRRFSERDPEAKERLLKEIAVARQLREELMKTYGEK